MKENYLRDHAIEYFRHGWQVMPCRNKEPLLSSWGWLRDRRATESNILRWWGDAPDAQIALICGRMSGITILDIDWLKTHEEKKKIILYADSIPPAELATFYTMTPQSVSGTLGRHVFFKSAKVPNSTKAIHPQIDVKSEGGYVILPPSPYEDSELDPPILDARYSWDLSGPLWTSELAPFPEAYIETVKRNATEWKGIVTGVREGSRNTNETYIAGKLIRCFTVGTKTPEEWSAGLDTAWELVQAWNDRNQPPLEHTELKKTFINIAKRSYERYDFDR